MAISPKPSCSPKHSGAMRDVLLVDRQTPRIVQIKSVSFGDLKNTLPVLDFA
jgi:hypothetical protein